MFVRQRRVAINGTLLELPAGLIDEGEEPLASAQRELREETGSARWELARACVVLDVARLRQRARDGLRRRWPRRRGNRNRTRERSSRSSAGRSSEVEARLHELEDATTLIGLLLYPARGGPTGIVPPPMRIGVAKEIKPQEYRVALTPAGRASSCGSVTRSSSRRTRAWAASSRTLQYEANGARSPRSTRSGRARSSC